MNKSCEYCQYNGPYGSIINPCENCQNNYFMITVTIHNAENGTRLYTAEKIK